jgi:hypothetical protein
MCRCFFVVPRFAHPRFAGFRFGLLISSIILLLTAVPIDAAQVKLAWNANTEPTLAGYKVYYGVSSGNYTSVVDAGLKTKCVVSGLKEGKTYYFAATAYDRSGNESDFSKEISYTVASGDTAGGGAPIAAGMTLSTRSGVEIEGVLKGVDPDGDPLSFQIVRRAGKGRVTLRNASTGSFLYTPAAGAGGSDSFDFKVSDGKSCSNVATVNITVGKPVKVYCEAEKGELVSPAVRVKNEKASGGRYVRIPGVKADVVGKAAVSGVAEFKFNAPYSGYYFVLVRLMCVRAGENRFRVSMDYGEEFEWTTAVGGKGAWVWDRVREGDSGEPHAFYLKKGEHILAIQQGMQVLNIDNLLVSTQPDIIPSMSYEDGEDGGIEGWEVVDLTPRGAEIINIYDSGRQSRVVQLSGSGTKNAFRLRSEDYSKWSNANRCVLEWSMSFDGSFVVAVDIETDQGYRSLRYSPVNRDPLGEGKIVQFGLGKRAADGAWRTFVRDLQADLERAQPGLKILKVNGFTVRGSGKVDDISLKDAA